MAVLKQFEMIIVALDCLFSIAFAFAVSGSSRKGKVQWKIDISICLNFLLLSICYLLESTCGKRETSSILFIRSIKVLGVFLLHTLIIHFVLMVIAETNQETSVAVGFKRNRIVAQHKVESLKKNRIRFQHPTACVNERVCAAALPVSLSMTTLVNSTDFERLNFPKIKSRGLRSTCSFLLSTRLLVLAIICCWILGAIHAVPFIWIIFKYNHEFEMFMADWRSVTYKSNVVLAISCLEWFLSALTCVFIVTKLCCIKRLPSVSKTRQRREITGILTISFLSALQIFHVTCVTYTFLSHKSVGNAMLVLLELLRRGVPVFHVIVMFSRRPLLRHDLWNFWSRLGDK